MGFVLDNAHVFSFGKLRRQELRLGAFIRAAGDEEGLLDYRNRWVLPGLIDVHVHFRVPGGEHKEDWKTGSLSAAHGGITQVMDMPNTRPPTTTRKEWEEKRRTAQRDSRVRAGFHFGATRDNFEEAVSCEGIRSVKMYLGSSTGTLLVDDERIWERWFRLCKEKDWVSVVHAEYEPLIREHASRFDEDHVHVHNKIRDVEVEARAIGKALELQSRIGNKLHVAHLSSKAGLELVSEAKETHPEVTCEACPHHLFQFRSS